MFDSSPFVTFPIAQDKALGLLDHLNIEFEVFYYLSRSQLFAGTKDLPELWEKAASWSGPSLEAFEAFEQIDDALVRALGQGVELPKFEEEVDVVMLDNFDATPYAQDTPPPLQLGRNTETRAWHSSPSTPTFKLATGSPKSQKSVRLPNSPRNPLSTLPGPHRGMTMC